MSILIMDMDPPFHCRFCGCSTLKLTRFLTWECADCQDSTEPVE